MLWEQKDNSRKKRQNSADEQVSAKKHHSDDSPVVSNDETLASTSKAEDNANNVNKSKLIEILNNESKFTNEEFHGKLKEIDPVMARRLHPNNRRKVFR